MCRNERWPGHPVDRCPCAGADTDMHVSVRTKAIAAPPMSRMTLAPVRRARHVTVSREPVIDRVRCDCLVTNARVACDEVGLRDPCENGAHDAVASRPQKAECVRRCKPGVLEELATNGATRTRQSSLDDGFADVERVRHFFSAHAFDLSQHEHFTRTVWQSIDCRFDQRAKLARDRQPLGIRCGVECTWHIDH